MPNTADESGFSWESLTDLEITHVKLEGRVDLGLLLRMADALYADPDYVSNFDGIIDLRGCSFELDFRDLMRYIDRVGSDPQHMKGNVAFVTDGKSAYGMSRMYSGLAPELQDAINIETSLEAAIAWLTAQRSE